MANTSVLRQPLPSIPEWFSKALANIATHHGKPFFRIVNGQTETRFLNGDPEHIKHLLMSMPYITVEEEQFRRQTKEGGWKYYATWEKASKDQDKDVIPLSEKKMQRNSRKYRQAVGRPCWVIEYFQSEEELSYNDWEAHRYAYLPKNNVVQRIDLLGEYPSKGRYVFLMNVLDSNGNAIAPHQGIIDLLTAGYKERLADNRTLEQCIRDDEYASQKFEEQQMERMNDHFYQMHGISAKRLTDTAISRPILQVKT